MGRKYRCISTFDGGVSNTVCDVTGFVVKSNQVMRRWDGVYCIPEAWHLRHPQDTPVIPKPQKVYSNVRTQSENTDTAASFDTI